MGLLSDNSTKKAKPSNPILIIVITAVVTSLFSTIGGIIASNISATRVKQEKLIEQKYSLFNEYNERIFSLEKDVRKYISLRNETILYILISGQYATDIPSPAQRFEDAQADLEESLNQMQRIQYYIMTIYKKSIPLIERQEIDAMLYIDFEYYQDRFNELLTQHSYQEVSDIILSELNLEATQGINNLDISKIYFETISVLLEDLL